jgi:glucose/arabinose dehydrogenase
MRMQRMAVLMMLALGGYACQKKTPPTPTPTPDGVVTVSGGERLGWDQRAADTVELSTFRYAIYVDGARSEVAETSCGPAAGTNGFACTGRLPPMTPGQHTLELATFVVDDGSTLESARSTGLRVNVTSSTIGLRADALRPGDAGTTLDGVRLHLEVVADSLDEAVDIAFAPDGRLFIAERAGTLRVVESSGRGASTSTLDGGVLALALDPDFERSRFVYVAQASREKQADGDAPPAFSVSRYREVNGTLGERMVLIHGVPTRPERASAALGVGPDGKLYVAFDDGGSARQAEDIASLNGKLLRLNRDGTTPDDQPAGAPVQGSGYRSPRGFDWSAGGVMWIADGAPRVPERLNALVATSTRPRRTTVATSYALPQNTDPLDAVIYRADLIPAFRGNLFVAAGEGGHILRVRFDRRSPTRVIATEKLLEGVGHVRAIAAGPDGAIYFATPTSIGRLSPARP